MGGRGREKRGKEGGRERGEREGEREGERGGREGGRGKREKEGGKEDKQGRRRAGEERKEREEGWGNESDHTCCSLTSTTGSTEHAVRWTASSYLRVEHHHFFRYIL